MRLGLIVAAALAAACGNAFAVGSIADVAVYNRAVHGALLPVHWGEGTTWVVGAPGNEYAIRIRNRSAADLLAVVSVDGVNVVTGQTASPEQSGYVIPAYRSVEIKGWRKSLQRIASFYFTDLGDSYAARTGRPDNVGVIGVALFKPKQAPGISLEERDSRWGEPAAAAANRASGAKSQSRAAEKAAPAPSLGTGHGRGETSHARYVEFERESSTPNEVVTIRYDSRENLVALGIIGGPRRQPDPFPSAFVPDPY